MKFLSAYNPSEVRACGKMVKGLLAAGGKAEDILGYAAFAEKHGANPIISRMKLTFNLPETLGLTKQEILGAIGYNALRSWISFSKKVLKLGIDLDEVQSYLKAERKKSLASTTFGPVRP